MSRSTSSGSMSNVTRPAPVVMVSRISGHPKRQHTPRLRRLNNPFQRRTKALPVFVFELSDGIGPPIKVREDALGKKRLAILSTSVEDTWRMGFRASLRKAYQKGSIVAMRSESVNFLDVLFRSHRRGSGYQIKGGRKGEAEKR